MMKETLPRILTIAGSDSGGGAGIQADLKAINAMGGWGTSAIASLTAQSPLGVYGIHDVPAAFVVQQMDVVLRDLGVVAIKTGMLSSAVIINAVSERLAEERARKSDKPWWLVVDPVMVATSGARLLREEALDALRMRLLPLANFVTPNVPEAEILSGMEISGEEEVCEAGARIHRLLNLDAQAYVLMKGGHLPGAEATDWLFDGSGWERFSAPRVEGVSTHGTGCTYASALAALLPQVEVHEAVRRAKAYVTARLREALGD